MADNSWSMVCIPKSMGDANYACTKNSLWVSGWRSCCYQVVITRRSTGPPKKQKNAVDATARASKKASEASGKIIQDAKQETKELIERAR